MGGGHRSNNTFFADTHRVLLNEKAQSFDKSEHRRVIKVSSAQRDYIRLYGRKKKHQARGILVSGLSHANATNQFEFTARCKRLQAGQVYEGFRARATRKRGRRAPAPYSLLYI